jgi:hypothetical protein
MKMVVFSLSYSFLGGDGRNFHKVVSNTPLFCGLIAQVLLKRHSEIQRKLGKCSKRKKLKEVNIFKNF